MRETSCEGVLDETSKPAREDARLEMHVGRMRRARSSTEHHWAQASGPDDFDRNRRPRGDDAGLLHARISDDAGGPQLLHAGRTVSKPIAVDERVVLANRWRWPHASRAGV